MATLVKEVWKPIVHLKTTTDKKYLVSSLGRIASYVDDIKEKFVLVLHLNGGFPMATINIDGKPTALFAHHAVGHSFLKKKNPKCNSLIHLDFDKANNNVENLKWVTKLEQIEHTKNSPLVIEANKRKVFTGATARKLNPKKVIALKKEIWNPKRKLSFKQIAQKYGIAEMNLYRIKNGEMWFHVHIDEEPIFPRYKQQLENIAFHAKVKEKNMVLVEKKKALKLAKKQAKLEQKEKLRLKKQVAFKAFMAKRKEQSVKNKALKAIQVKQAIAARKAAKVEKEKALRLAKEKKRIASNLVKAEKLRKAKAVKAEKLKIQKEKNEALKQLKAEKLRKAKAVKAEKKEKLKAKKSSSSKPTKSNNSKTSNDKKVSVKPLKKNVKVEKTKEVAKSKSKSPKKKK